MPQKSVTSPNPASASGTTRKRISRTGGKRKNMMKEEIRQAFLEHDEWTKDVQPRSVTCGGCNKILSLDKRKGTYYASLWLKHRDACRSIKRLRAGRTENKASVNVWC
jgi:hypothetical protein